MASRHAMKIAADERRYGWLLSRGVLTFPDDAKARAQAEAVECPQCGRLVHPTNQARHDALYHLATGDWPLAVGEGQEREGPPREGTQPQRAETQLRPYAGMGVPLLCAVNPGSPLAVPVVAAPAKVVQMPMPQMMVNKAKVSLIAMTITALVDAAIDGNYDALDEAMADIQHELYRVAGADESLRGEYREAIRKELYSSDTLEALEGVA